MASDVPWRFRGLRPEVREAAIAAARRAGVPVGEWLNEIIIDSAAEEGVYPEPPAPAGPPPPPQDDLSAIRTRLEELSRQLDRLSQPTPATEQPAVEAPVVEVPAAIESKPAPAAPATAAPSAETAAGAGAGATAAPAQPEAAATPAAAEPAPSPQPDSKPDNNYALRLDQAVAEIRSRRQALDNEPLLGPAPTSEPAALAGGAASGMSAALEQQLRNINRQIESLRQPCGAADAVAMLRGDLAAITQLLKSALPQRAIELLEAEIRNLTRRIDEQRGNGGSAAAIANLERGLDDLRETLKTLKPAESLVALDAAVKDLSGKVEQINAQSTDAAALVQLDTSIAGLRAAIGNVASTEVVSRLAEDMRALSAKVDEVASSAGGGADLLSSLEQRISAMADTLEQHNRECGKTPPHLEDVLALLVDRLEQTQPPAPETKVLDLLETRLATVTSRLDDLQPAHADLAVLRQIEDRISAMAERFDPGTLRDIEDRIATLTDRMIQLAPAESTADALRQLEDQVASLHSRLDQPPAAAPSALHQIEDRIETLFAKLDEISRSSRDPEALRDLEQRIATIGSKLDASDARFAHLEAIEHGLAGVLAHVEDLRAGQAETLLRATMPQTDNVAVDAIKREIDELKHTEQRTQNSIDAVHGTLGSIVDRLAMIENDLRRRSAETADAAPRAPAAAPEPLPAARGLATEIPLEPAGTAARAPAEPDSTTRSESPAAPAPAAPTSDPSARLNFIAAARRAAQAAAAERPRNTARTQTGRDQQNNLGAPPKGKNSPTRSIIVGISVLVIVLGTTHIVWNFLAAPDGSSATAIPAAVPIDRAESKSTNPASAAPTAPDSKGATKATPAGKPAPGHDRTEGPDANDRTGSIGAPLLTPIIPEAVPVTANQPGSFPPAAPAESGTGSRAGLTPPPAEPLQPAPVVAPVVEPVVAPVALNPAATPATPEARDNTPSLPAAIGSSKLREAALKGDAVAQFEIGSRYAEGVGVAQDLAEAARWFERAAEQGLTPAQFQIASLYEKGRGVKKNLQAARRFYAAAAQGGNAKAMHNLAVLYAEGLAGKSDYATAAMWFRMAANRGVTDSQYNLGILYARGIGVDRNLAESYKWFALAAKRGDKEADNKRDEIGTQLDEAELAAAERAVAGFVAEPQPESASKVSPPAGGWDEPASAASSPKSRPNDSSTGRPRRNKGSSKS